MLTDLHVAGLALLDDCDLELKPGLTAITGETGAGKTMLLTALRLLSGGRADPKTIAAGQSRTEVDALMQVPAEVITRLAEAGIDTDGAEVAFSRTVTPSRSRASISGRPVTAAMLQDTVGSVITIHGQADQLRLKSPSHQRELLDAYAGEKHLALVGEYGKLWKQVRALQDRLDELESNHDRLEVELRYLQEITTEVDSLDPRPDEEDILDAAIDRLDNVEQLRQATMSALRLLSGPEGAAGVYGDSGGAAAMVGRALEELRRASDLDSSLTEVSNRAGSLEVELVTLAGDLRDYTEQLLDDPEELSRLHQRRAALVDLCRGRAKNAAELLAWADRAKGRIAELEGAEADPESARRALTEAQGELQTLAASISASRKAAAAELAERVKAEFQDLALADAVLHIEVARAPLSATGADQVTMMLQPHPNVAATPLGEGASGGELSRVMLALEVVLADSDTSQTMVFDEVDAGIGGLTANQVGARLAALSRFHQVIVVTHLPQIAALATTNLVVTKHDGNACVRQVEGEERTDEIVRMLGGDDQAGAARRHALKLETAAAMGESET